MILEINSEQPDAAVLDECVNLLRKGEVIVCPTDTVYAYVCDSRNARAIEKLAKLKGVRLKKANLSLLCSDLSELSIYASQVATPAFRIMKQTLPGPYTYVLRASRMIPSLFKNKKRTVGIRIPDDEVVRGLLEKLGHALAATSVHSEDLQEYHSDARDIEKHKGHLVACVLDAGSRGLEGSTVVDLTDDIPVLLREGAGDIDLFQ